MTDTARPVATRRATMLLVIFALSTLFFAVRIQNTETLVTNDEPFWLGRSANFHRALTQWEPEYSYQMAHPGVTVMWAGALAFWSHGSEYSQNFDTNSDWPFYIDDRLIAAGIDPMEMLQHIRIVKLGFETILFAIALFFITGFSPQFIAATTGLLIAMDPFLAGFGPLLHVDSLLAMSLFTATLALVWASRIDRSEPWRWLIAGAIAATAVLTRSTAVIIAVPLLLVALSLWRREGTKSVLRATAAWIAGFAGTYVLAWPALWVNPVSTVRAMVDWTLGAASGGHEHQIFFNGEIYFDDPGWFFYPVTLLWRTTPFVWIGIAFLLVSLRSRKTRKRLHPLLPVFAMGVSYWLVMSLGAKKFDRYILPVYPVLALVTALGFDAAIHWGRKQFGKFRQVVPTVGFALLAVLSLIPLTNAGPYRLNYYNEVMRIFDVPEKVVQIGWGEGGFEAVAFLERESERLGRPVTAQTFAIPSHRLQPPIRYFVIDEDGLSETVTFTQVGLDFPEDWQATDYYLFHIQQTQRGMAPEYALFEGNEPVYTVTFGGVTIWEIYAPSQLSFPRD